MAETDRRRRRPDRQRGAAGRTAVVASTARHGVGRRSATRPSTSPAPTHTSSTRPAARRRPAADAGGPRDLRRVLGLRARSLGPAAHPARRGAAGSREGGRPGEASVRSTTSSACATTCARARCASAASETGAYLAARSSGVPHLLELPGGCSTPSERLERDEAERGRAAGAPARRKLPGRRATEGACARRRQAGSRSRSSRARRPTSGTSCAGKGSRCSSRATRGIRVPGQRLHLIDGKPVLVVDRFDRSGTQPGRLRERDDDARGRRRRCGQLSRHRRDHREHSPSRGGRPARAVAPDRLLDPDQQHRRPPAQPWVPARRAPQAGRCRRRSTSTPIHGPGPSA